MPGNTAYDEGVMKEIKWQGIWAKQREADRKAGRIKEPSPWFIGKYRRPERLPEKLPPVEDGKGTADSRPNTAHSGVAVTRAKSAPALEKMRTSHMETEMKRSFHIETSVLGKKFTPAYKIPRRMY
eukprot:CAMPEP_0197659140 /NCGR_PEP_ID=MMETSP1338-20131121/46372_1 /TAXON_ID=43686 ORGANISM="Pelagodinium beii, Strain RCC1491" /NCGR_SAMPLE_ID=MMETSP1338 /ASSEMBLY_ACC=CAM_ASM_000754 /LENGTH=125 /DNA_ID=CAMNT_0043235917 /DNA_START=44 /DNA_END=421 /DNA_ORIENTATION=+